MTTIAPDRDAAAFAARLFDASLCCAELMTSYLGLDLGLYHALRDTPATSAELAERTGIHERYAREWLEQQAAAGYLDVDAVTAPARRRRFHVGSGQVAVLLDPSSRHYTAPLALMPVASMVGALPSLARAFRDGGGVTDAEFASFHGGALNAALYDHDLAGWLRDELPDVHTRLGSGGESRIVDLACGTGDSTFALARAYPNARVYGADIDASAISDARRRNSDAGFGGRVDFVVADVTDADDVLAKTYSGCDLVTLMDSLHDMAAPVAALATCRALLAEGGAVMLLEPRARERFTAPADSMERFIYACSVLHCLPVGMSSPDTAATGAVMRPATLRGYAVRAGFSSMRVLNGGSRFHRLYRLNP